MNRWGYFAIGLVLGIIISPLIRLLFVWLGAQW